MMPQLPAQPLRRRCVQCICAQSRTPCHLWQSARLGCIRMYRRACNVRKVGPFLPQDCRMQPVLIGQLL